MNYYQLLSLERPPGLVGVPRWAEDLTHMLPSKAQERGMVMLEIAYQQPEYSRDPVMIFDKEGKILHQWPDEYVPGWLEIQKVCKTLLK